MTKKTQKWILIPVSLAAVLWFGPGNFDQVAKAQIGAKPDTTAAKSRIPSGSIRTVELDDPEWRQALPLRQMVSESRVIVIAEIARNTCRRSRDGQNVMTDYTVQIRESIKGGYDPDSSLVVTSYGGMIVETDGSIFNQRTPAIAKMIAGRKYLMFLKNATGEGSMLRPIRGSQGIYEIAGTRAIHLGLPIYREADIGEASAFLNQVRGLIRDR